MRICEWCGEPIPETARKDKRFCKRSHASMAYASKHSETQEQKAEKNRLWNERHPERRMKASQENYKKRRDAGKLAAMPSKAPARQVAYTKAYYARKRAQGYHRVHIQGKLIWVKS